MSNVGPLVGFGEGKDDPQTSRINEEITKAKTFFVFHSGLEDEPEANRDQILLRELEHAMELLIGPQEEDNICAIHSALRGGELVAESLGGRLVPRDAWPQNTDIQGSHWLVSVPDNNAVQGFKGKLIFIPRQNVVEWLKGVISKAPKVSPALPPKPKPVTKVALEKLFTDFLETYQEGDWPSEPERIAWAREAGATRARVRELWNEFKKPHMSTSGKRTRLPRKTR